MRDLRVFGRVSKSVPCIALLSHIFSDVIEEGKCLSSCPRPSSSWLHCNSSFCRLCGRLLNCILFLFLNLSDRNLRDAGRCCMYWGGGQLPTIWVVDYDVVMNNNTYSKSASTRWEGRDALSIIIQSGSDNDCKCLGNLSALTTLIPWVAPISSFNREEGRIFSKSSIEVYLLNSPMITVLRVEGRGDAVDKSILHTPIDNLMSLLGSALFTIVEATVVYTPL